MQNDSTIAPCWVEIDLNALAHNVAQVKHLLQPDVELMAVVKANGYGHGTLQAARVALAHGASMLGVQHPHEGADLRGSGITAPILVLRSLLPGEEETVLAHRLTASLGDLEQAMRLADAAQHHGVQVPVHIKIDTGMTRLGFLPATFLGCLDELMGLPSLMWEGIYTHFPLATDRPFTLRQFSAFMKLVSDLVERGITFPLRHVCNSPATLLYPNMHLDMVRVGTLLYGQLPAGISTAPLSLRQAWSFWTRVVHLRSALRGSTVGYGRTHRLRRDSLVAVLPVGYADGFGVDVVPRPEGFCNLVKVLVKIAGGYCGLPWGGSQVTINGGRAPVLGRIGMGLTCVDVTKVPNVKVGTPVLLSARRTVLRESIPRVYKE